MKAAIEFLLFGLMASMIAFFATANYSLGDDSPAIPALRAATLHLPNGSGFLIKGRSGKTYLVTNYHVCIGTMYRGTLFGSLPDGTQARGRVVAQDFRKDLCAALIQAPPAGALTIAKVSWIHEDAYTRGYPQGVLTDSHGSLGEMTNWEYTFPIEMIGECPSPSRKARDIYNTVIGCTISYHSQRTTLFSHPGSSGSPVVNPQGELIGVVSSWLADKDYDAGIVPLDQVKSFMEAL